MLKIAGLVLIAGCSLYSGGDEPAPADAVTPVACESAVVETCGPRPERPEVDTEVWAHDIDLWAKCAEGVE